MGAVVASHGTDLWGVVLVTLGVLTAVAFYGGPHSLGPAGHGASQSRRRSASTPGSGSR